MKKRLIALDIAKLIMALLVLCIHYGFFGLDEEFKKTLPRVAVPFFFIVSGFFFYQNDVESLDKKYVSVLKKTVLICLISVSFYICFDLINIIKQNGSTVDYFRNIFSKESLKLTLVYQDFGVNVHLWFVLSYPIAFTLTYLILKFKNNNYLLIFLCVSLLLINLILGNYSNLIKCETELSMSRNAYVCALPFILVGCLIRKNYKFFNNKSYIAFLTLGIIMFIMQYYENKIISQFFIYRYSDLYLSTIISSICLFIGIINIKCTSEKFYIFYDKNIPLLIYILQKFVNTKCWEIELLHPIMNSKYQTLFIFVVLYIISLILCKLYNILTKRYRIHKSTIPY